MTPKNLTTLQMVYLARHGETAWSLSGQHTGLTDIPLTEHGERNAFRIGQRLAGMSFAMILTSPLKRAIQTCQLAGFGSEARAENNLVEWNYGNYEGRRTAEIQTERPDWELFHDGCPGGESPEEVGGRADAVISRLRATVGDVLIFSSGHFLRVLAARWLGLEPATGRFLALDTASLSLRGYENSISRPAIRLWNDRGHLDDKARYKSKT